MLAAKSGVYTFATGSRLTKNQIRELIDKLFNVHVKAIKSINYRSGTKKNFRGRKVVVKAYKKVMVSLADKEKIDLFTKKD